MSKNYKNNNLLFSSLFLFAILSHMTNKTQTLLLFIILILAAVTVGAAIKYKALQQTDSLAGSVHTEVQAREAIFTTAQGEEGRITYRGQEQATVKYKGETYELTRTESASGTRYANADQSFVFFAKGDEAIIEQNGEVIADVNEIRLTQNANSENSTLLTFDIAAEKADCVGVGPMKCLVVNGELFYDSIEGFDFKEGVEYTILVERTAKENVPADAGAYAYRRVEVLKSNKQGDPSANKYDFQSDNVDNDCDDSDDSSRCSPGDPIPGIEIVVGQGDPEALDDDSDGDAIPTEGAAQDVIETVGPLASSAWMLTTIEYDNQDDVTLDSDAFIATFSNAGQFSSQTDCNTIGGAYMVDGNDLDFGALLSTKMACPGETFESEYIALLSKIENYSIDNDGQLNLKFETGTMIFIPVATVQQATDYNSSRSNKSY